MKTKEADVLVIGGGAAGLGAATEAAKEGKSVLLLEKGNRLGGILNQCIHVGFGLSLFKKELTGPEFSYELLELLKKEKAEVMLESIVISLKPDLSAEVLSKEEGYLKILPKAVILATGSLERSAGAIGLSGDRPGGIYPAGEAQLLLNLKGHLVGKKIFILGSGDVGLIMARRFSLEGAEVVAVAERNPYLGGLLRNKVQCLDDFGIPLLLSRTVKRVDGKERVRGVLTVGLDEEGKEIAGSEVYYECDTLVLSVGLIPNWGLLKTIKGEKSSSGGPMVYGGLMSSIRGLFVAGNSLHVHDLADEAYIEGVESAKEACRYIEGEKDFRDGPVLVAKEGVAGLLPGNLHFNEEGKAELCFRPKLPVIDGELFLEQGGKTIKKLFKMKWLPSIMEHVTITENLLINDYDRIEVTLRRKA